MLKALQVALSGAARDIAVGASGLEPSGVCIIGAAAANGAEEQRSSSAGRQGRPSGCRGRMTRGPHSDFHFPTNFLVAKKIHHFEK
jgi:hypothetical protein